MISWLIANGLLFVYQVWKRWEIASRAESSSDYYFGNDKSKISRYANIWLGRDHLNADSSDGFMYHVTRFAF
jgi:formylglycine-generating enzyme required for sulfatase activity